MHFFKLIFKQTIPLYLSILFHVSADAQELDSILRIAETKPISEETVEWLTDVAYDYYMINPAITEALGKRAIAWGRDLDFPLGTAKAYHIIGISYWARGLYQTAISHYLDALPFYELAGDPRRANGLKLDIASIYADTRNFQKSIELQREVMSFARETNDSLIWSWTLTNIGESYKQMGKYDSAEFYYMQDVPILEALRDTTGIALLHSNIGSLFIEQGRHESALPHLQTARNQLRMKQSNEWLAQVYINLSQCELAFRNYLKAKSYLDSARVKVNEIDSRELRVALLETFSTLYQSTGNMEEALYLYRKSKELQDSISGTDVRKQVEILQLEYENEKKEKELVILENEKIQTEYRYYVSLISGGSFLSLAILFIYSLRLRVNNSKLREKELKHELERKNRELASYTINFLQKNEIMEEIKGKVNALKRESTPDTNKKLLQLNKMIDESFRVDNDWEHFKLRFEEVHPRFFEQLKNQYEGISNAELKLCALLRLNFNLKEAAKILGISPESVKTARYRLRKKLNLEREANLIDFILKI